MSFLRNTGSVFATSVLILPLGLAGNIFLARGLGAAHLGIYSVLLTFATISILITQLGWPSAVIYRIRSDHRPAPTVIGSGILCTALIGAIAVLGILLFQNLISTTLLHDASVEYIRIAMWIIPIELFGRLFVGVSRAIDRFSIGNLYRLILSAGIAILSGVLWGTENLHLEAGLRITVLSHAVSTALIGALLLRRTGVSFRIDLEEIKACLKYGGKSHLQSLAGNLHEQVDIFMLAALYPTPTAVGFYAIAVGVASRLKLVPNAVSSALFTQVTGADLHQAAEWTSKSIRFTVATVSITAILIALVSGTVIPFIWGAEYVESVGPLLILLPAVIFLTVHSVATRYFMSRNQHGVVVLAQAVSIIVNVSLNLLWIPEHGAKGAAFASLVSYSLEAIGLLLIFKKRTGLRMSECLFISKEDIQSVREKAFRKRSA